MARVGNGLEHHVEAPSGGLRADHRHRLLDLPARAAGGFLWDDDVYVTNNVTLRSVPGLVDIWRLPPSTRQYYPLTFTVFWLEYQAWGDAPLGYHVVNVALHAANAILVWRILATLGVAWPFLAAWLFAVHPIQVESVAWIAELKNVLSAFFALLATLFWLRYLSSGRRSYLVLSGVSFVLGILSKTQICALPVVLFLLTWWRKPERLRCVVGPVVALSAVAVAASAVTIWMEPSKQEVLFVMPPLDLLARVLVAGRALWFYVGQLAWPADLRTIYGHWSINTHDLVQFSYPLSAALLLMALWLLCRRAGKGSFVAVAAFVLSVAPVLGLLDFGFMLFAFGADRFVYLGSIPMIALAVAGAARIIPEASSVVLRAIPLGMIAAAVVVCSLLSLRRATAHSDAELLWRDNIARDPRCATAHNHLGVVLFSRGRVDDAIASFRTALGVDSDLVDAQHGLGMALQKQGRIDEAIAEYTAGLKRRPNSRTLRNSIGVALQAKGDTDAAIELYEEALRLDPGYAQGHNNLGTALYLRGNVSAAIERFQAAVELLPTYGEAQDNLGVALRQAGRLDEAIAHLEIAVRLSPKSPVPRRHLDDALAAKARAQR